MAIKACTMLHDYKRGINILQKLSSKSLSNNSIQISLIRFYLECRDVDNAVRLFSSITNKSNYMYTAMFKGLRSNGMNEKIIDLLEEMKIQPNKFTLTLSFHACAQVATARAVKIGQRLLHNLLDNSCNDDILLSAAAHMLSKFCDMVNAERVYKLIKKKNIIMCGGIMQGYIDKKMFEKALNLFEQMNCELDHVAYTMVFNACAKLGGDRAITIGNKLVKELPDNCQSSTTTLNSAIHMFMTFGDIKRAERIFQIISKKDVITYGTMMKGYIQNEMFEKSLDLFEHMNCELDHAMYTIAFNVCAKLGNDRAITIGNKLFNELSDSCKSNKVILTSAMDMFMKFDDIQKAESVFQIIPKKDAITYGAMMKGYIQNEMFEKSLDLFEHMNCEVAHAIYTMVFNACAKLGSDRAITIGNTLFHELPDSCKNNTAILTSAMYMFMKFGDIENAERVFYLIQDKDTIFYGALMNGYNMNDAPEKCLKVFEAMKQHNVVPNENTWTILIGAYSQIAMIRECEYLVSQIPPHILKNQRVQTALIDMWGKCGSVKEAKHVYNLVSEHDTFTYGAMINAFGLNGMGCESITTYRQMPNNLRDDISHISVLNACSHAGLLLEAQAIFNEVSVKTEKITGTMIDCYSRMYLIDEAQKLVDDYEKTNSPSFIMYMSLLSGARNSHNTILSEKIYNRMLSLFPDKKDALMSGMILVSNTYSSLGEDELAYDFRSHHEKKLGTHARVGLSWTDANGEIVKFSAHDRSHSSSLKIQAEIGRMTTELIEHGHQFNSSCITRRLNDGETVESILMGHSEKIAIAFNFIQEPIPEFIQVRKNLRVCFDCHAATKLLAKIRQRDIIIRDANRIHHFQRNGQCSCLDHF
ncbi:unnamed protein product [Rotaria socialis]|nr:unnamed protein product [Rotaria socialis]